MRSTRLLAASAALATTALGLGATTASAAEAPKMPCFGGVQHHPELATTWTGFPAELVKGGPAAESTVTFRNSVDHDVKDFRTALYVTALDGGFPAGSFTVEFKAPGGQWKKADFGTGDLASIVDTQTYQIPKGSSLTLALRIAATAKAPAGKYQTSESGGSALLEDDSDTFLPLAPAEQKPASDQNGTGTCTQFIASAAHDFAVVNNATTASPSAQPSHAASPTASPTATAGTPSTAPTTQAAHKGPELAETGADNTVPIAIGGAAVLALGAAILVALRRRRGTHR
ncbi:LPXTG cell wall anchor domain-containing protein [Kitasatospora cineracea]|uniref:LPXTG cell wall anchor domain-containing protein n=1 Tax=Kitasatospora cineracea TaxID=88074 RepID=UPI0033E1A5C1